MKIISSKNKLIKIVQKEKDLGFVPTMGAIHLGHISLIEKSITQCKRTIVSIFINKPQFNKKMDYKKYPRILIKDIAKLKRLKIDYLYLPTTKQIYPKGINNKISIIPFSKKLCGKFRPNHFRAVVDVIDRFIKLIKPKKIYFGKKDMQQLKIIEHFVKKNHKKIKVIGCNTIRENNGIPYSSRNFLLTPREKINASKIYNFLKRRKKFIIKNKTLLSFCKKKIMKMGANKIDYIEIVDINNITRPFVKSKKYKIFIAYYLGQTRLIDNI